MKFPKLFRATLFCLLILSALTLYTFNSFSNSSAQSVTPKNPVAAPVQVSASPVAANALARLQSSSGTQIVSHVSRATGVYDFVRMQGTATLPAVDNILATPESRARTFLSQNGDLVGMNATERTLVASSNAPAVTVAASALKVAKVSTDAIGSTHVKFDQTYKGMNVFGAQLVVHMNSGGITGINGNFVPGVNATSTPRLTTAQAGQYAKGSATNLSATKFDLNIYRTGLLEGQRGESVLAYAVEVTDGKSMRDQVWIDATKGTKLNRITLNPHGLDRIIYTPVYGEPFDVRHEGDPYTPGPTPGTTGADGVNNLYRFAGETYNLWHSAFGRDSYDGLGHTMHSVLLANNNCPNAYWNGVSTNYCPDFDADDVVSHEWGHAYTEYTHNLIYAYQSGALNESYSDIFGETHDLINGVDAEGGSNNTQPMPNGQRWQIGEDVNGFNQPAAGILRDMWDPTTFGQPDKTTSANYSCGSGDGGGVHANSGVPNHAYAMLVDGKTFNGQTVEAIGLTRALHIYFRAMTVYQTRTTDFAGHAAALQASCEDLRVAGTNLNGISTSSPNSVASGEVVTAHTCQQVNKAILAVELNVPAPCPIVILLDPDAPAACDGATNIFTEDWEDGNMTGWTKTSTGLFPEWEDASRPLRDFYLSSTPPAGHTGITALAKAPAVGQPGGGDCTPVAGMDYSGQFSIDSPTIVIPANANDVKLSFDHYVATEAGVDGGQLELSVNGGPFQLVASSEYIYNYPKTAYAAPPPVGNNTNPNPTEPAWTGANVGTPPSAPPGSWGTTIVNLSTLTNPGNSVKVRFNWSQDGCNGVDGWYVDNIRVYSCALLEAPVLSLGGDYQNPDPDGSYTLTWTRPAGASGPDLVQESSGSCAPLLFEDAETGMDGWTVTNVGTGAVAWTTATDKPQHTGTTFKGSSLNGTTNNATILTYNNPIAIPATGTTSLTFDDWDVNEGEDNMYVEVSTDGGTNWETAYQHNRSALAPDAATAFATETLFGRFINLASYGGQTIRLRFRFQAGPEDRPGSAPMGWYLDNIAIDNDSWSDLVSTATTSHTVTGRPSGTRCYRVRTSYAGVAGPFSNEVSAVSSLAAQCETNFAHASFGSTATASSTASARNYSPAGAINGDRIGVGWEQGGGWNDNTRDVWPDELEISFNNSRTINEIRVFTLQNNYQNPVDPTASTPADVYGILDFDVQYWNGSTWVTVPGGEIRGNDKALTTVSFANVTTTKIRIRVLNGRAHFSRIVEVEAIGCP